MKIVKAFSLKEPEALTVNVLPDGQKEVWIRKNIRKQSVHFDEENEQDEYAYDEVYFRTNKGEEDIRRNVESYWQSGQDWKPDIPMDPEKRILHLEEQVKTAKEDLITVRSESDMAIAEIMMLIAKIGGAWNV